MQTQTPLQSMQKLPKRKRRRNLVIGLIALIILIIAIASTSHGGTSQQASSTPTTQPTSQATNAPTQPVHYPPTTQADLRELAALGDASAIHEFHSESVGAVGACPQPKREVTVDPGITGQQLAEDLLAYFYGQQLDSPCGSLVLAYHNQNEADNAYTAGRINFDASQADGSPNFDPNATNLKYSLTLDVGGIDNGQEYVVTY